MSKVNFKSIHEAMLQTKPGASKPEQRQLVLSALMEELPEAEILKNRFDSQSLEDLSETVQRLWAALDRGSEKFIAGIVEEIVDNYSAKLAVEYYTPTWFKSLLVSVNVKSSLAEALIKTCHPYLGRNVPSIWLNLAVKVPETMKSMEFTLEDATT